jgi:prepilin-type N-terminal cleavage/methylation domain-containing protein/prepilin-type processing-associated H-X9-DG protein
MQTMRRRGFTLIELLVVIAIIAILAAILFPVFARAREKARQTSCLSNSKQINLCILMYVQDYDELLPFYWYGASVGYWPTVLMPYVKNWDMFTCPSAPTLKGGTGWTGSGGYGYNYYFLGGWSSSNNAFGPFSLAEVASPSETLVTGEINQSMNPGVIYPPPPTLAESYWAQTADRHNEGLNVGFLDGHSKWMKISTLHDSPGLFDRT